MKLDELKKYIELAETKYRENPALQQLVNTAAGAGIGYGLGSIEVSKDPKSRWRGNLFGTDKGLSRRIGALTGAIAGLHAPILKKAEGVGPVGDVIAGYPGAALLGAVPGGAMVPSAAYIAGLLSKEDNSQKSIGPAFIPGVSSYRLGNRIKTQVKRELRQIEEDEKNKGARPVAHAVAEHLGAGTSMLAPILAGAGIGGAVDGKNGALIGGATGAAAASVATLAGAIAAAIKRRRTAKEQIEADKGSVLAKYLIPGAAAYGQYKRLGRSQGERDEAEAKGKSEKKAELPDWSNIKGNINWSAFKQKLQEVKDWYESRPAEQRALIGAGVGLGGGALLGKLMGRTGTGAVAGALAGAGAGAYWNHVRKAIDAARSSGGISKAVSAVKPVVEDATKKTKDRIDAIAKKLGVTDKNTGTGESAAAKALAATGAVK